MYKWNHLVQTRVVQESTLLTQGLEVKLSQSLWLLSDSPIPIPRSPLSFSIKTFMLVELKSLSAGRKGFAISYSLYIFICLMFNLYQNGNPNFLVFTILN